MTRTLKFSLLLASMLVVTLATTSEACHRRKARGCTPAPAPCGEMAYGGYASPTGYASPQGAYAAPDAGYYGGGMTGYPGGAAGYPGGYPAGYDFGRPGYNPGGLGGPASGLGVRPGLGFGGLGRGR